MKKVIAFDLDETLTETRSVISDEMSELLSELLDNYQVCVISGGSFDQFQKQFIRNLKVNSKKLTSLHLMPTCGTRYYKYDLGKDDWQNVYAEDLSGDEKATITDALNLSVDEIGYRLEEPSGPLIEDRGSQITFSALGQDATPVAKKAWDPKGIKKSKLRDVVAKKIPQFEVRVGGTTSIDVTKAGIDKAYGMKKLTEILGITKKEILFIGDRLWEGGNDYPVKLMGIDTVAVGGYEHTPWVVRGILAVS